MGQAEEGTVSNLSELFADRFVDDRVAVSMKICPDGGVAIEISFTFVRNQPRAFPRCDRDGVKRRIHPDGVGGEGMP